MTNEEKILKAIASIQNTFEPMQNAIGSLQNTITSMQSTIASMQNTLESFGRDIDWLKENAATKADLIAERDHTRSIVHEEIQVNNRIFGTIMKVEINGLKQEVAGVLKNHEERLRALEEASTYKPPKN